MTFPLADQIDQPVGLRGRNAGGQPQYHVLIAEDQVPILTLKLRLFTCFDVARRGAFDLNRFDASKKEMAR